ncbi:unnamed protein product [Prorocentrum cordatum]|uniref:Arf-GAP domain-containing protein n=1 Tax=Prorocentrum cordatum TaxID=2364126 RepID=A0ABN9TFQ6_9DINO|nr:unnamed protein product [Polarella glacialis]
MGKVKQFDGSGSGWSTWEFHWRAYMDQLDDAKNATMNVDDVDWEDLSTQLYYMLVLAMPEDSAGETNMRNGECAPNQPGNVVARLRQLMSTQFMTNADVANEIEKLDLEISKSEKAAGEQLTDNIKKGILLGAHQNERDLRKDVFRNLRNLVTYLDVKNEDDCRKFKRENEAKAEAKREAKDEKKQRRAMASALAAGLLAEQGTIKPKYIFALTAEHSRPRARSAELSGSRTIKLSFVSAAFVPPGRYFLDPSETRAAAMRAHEPDNAACANCRAPKPEHVCMDFRVFVCRQCSEVHAEFGHRTMSIADPEWEDCDVDLMARQGGNKRAAAEWFAFWNASEFARPQGDDQQRRRDFIRKAYVVKCWQRQPRKKRPKPPKLDGAAASLPFAPGPVPPAPGAAHSGARTCRPGQAQRGVRTDAAAQRLELTAWTAHFGTPRGGAGAPACAPAPGGQDPRRPRARRAWPPSGRPCPPPPRVRPRPTSRRRARWSTSGTRRPGPLTTALLRTRHQKPLTPRTRPCLQHGGGAEGPGAAARCGEAVPEKRSTLSWGAFEDRFSALGAGLGRRDDVASLEQDSEGALGVWRAGADVPRQGAAVGAQGPAGSRRGRRGRPGLAVRAAPRGAPVRASSKPKVVVDFSFSEERKTIPISLSLSRLLGVYHERPDCVPPPSHF